MELYKKELIIIKFNELEENKSYFYLTTKKSLTRKGEVILKLQAKKNILIENVKISAILEDSSIKSTDFVYTFSTGAIKHDYNSIYTMNQEELDIFLQEHIFSIKYLKKIENLNIL